MPEIQLPATRLYYEEHGSGDAILLIHGTGSDAHNWGTAPEALAPLGRVISYDRRGCTRSARPEDYQHTTPAEHAADAAALLDGLSATPAIVIGRSYGGEVALELALRHPEQVRALVLLEGGGEGLSPEVSAFLDRIAARVQAAAAEHGPSAAGEALLRTVLGDAGYAAAPEGMKSRMAANGPAILAEMAGIPDVRLNPPRLEDITCPVLVVAAKSSPEPFRRLSETVAAAMPDARLVMVEGGHLITPADPLVVSFIQTVLAVPSGAH